MIARFIVFRFLIGREKNPEESEIARLIQESLARDRLRAQHFAQQQAALQAQQEAMDVENEVSHARLTRPFRFNLGAF